MKISLVIPAFEEEARVPPTLRRLARYLEGRPEEWEILFVDDGSSDRTAEVARTEGERLDLPLTVLRMPANRGKGAAIRRGVLAARGDWILVSDADLSTPIEEWEKLLRAGAPIAVGSRALEEELVREKQPWHRRSMGRTFNRLVRLLAVRGIHDTQCGFKLFDARVARELFEGARINRFAYDVEILARAQKRGIPIAEVPVLWFNSPDSRVAVVRDSLRMLRDLVRIRLEL
jgi:dolichyl-phosphate beta-glucosyltransferase